MTEIMPIFCLEIAVCFSKLDKRMSNIIVSTDKSRLNIPAIHAYLTQSYWGTGRTIETVQKSIDHSICFGVYLDEEQIGFARVVSDHTIFAYIMDVFIFPQHQGNGYGKRLMQAIMDHDDFSDVENWFLRTMDAQGLYTQFGFEEVQFPERSMHKRRAK